MRRTLRIAALSLAACLVPGLAGAELFPPPGPGPLGAPPAGIRVEITLPDGVELLPRSASLRIETGSDSAEIGLQRAAPPVPSPGGTRHLLGPTQTGAAALSGLQARSLGPPDPGTAMAVSMALCRRAAAPADRPFALAVRLAPGAPGLPLTAPDASLSRLTGAPPAALAPCR